MLDLVDTLTKRGHSIELLDIGGGIGIDYHKTLVGMEEYMEETYKVEKVTPPTVATFVDVISRVLPKTVNIILEPGRSLVHKKVYLSSVSIIMGVFCRWPTLELWFAKFLGLR